MLKPIQWIIFQLQDWLGEVRYVMRFFHWEDLVRPRKLFMMIREVSKLVKPLDKDTISSYLLDSTLGDMRAGKLRVTRWRSNPSKLIPLFLQLPDYVKIKDMDIIIRDDYEMGLAVVNYGYRIDMGTDYQFAVKERKLDPNHPIVWKLKGFLEKNGFTYVGTADIPVRNFMFQKDNISLIIQG